MFARLVTLKLKPNTVDEFSSLIDNEIVPLLRKQKGFRDELTFVNREKALAVGISLWNTKDDSLTYKSTVYPEVLKTLTKVLKGKPTVETFDVVSATLEKLAAKAATKAG